ncbi:MAG: DUF962 domain-containing protein [Bacteroidetes bacterium]|nr:DUF962 domain-containing protein [Bacteroidota bacterium]
MRTLKDWFDEYAESHMNPFNKKVHYICVPVIFFSIVGLIMSIPHSALTDLLPTASPVLINYAFPVLLFVNVFYMRLSPAMGLNMLIFSAMCLIGNYLLSGFVELWVSSLILFSAGWIGQFYGHKVEGKKPSFFKDLQFLLIGPAWVIHNIFNTTGK